MDCTRFRETHPAAAPEAQAHLAACAGCRAFAAAWESLSDYPELEPGPGFLAGVRRKLAPRILRFAAPVAAAAAALLVALVLWIQGPVRPEATAEERELVENLELLENYELLKTLEIVGETSSPLLEDRK